MNASITEKILDALDILAANSHVDYNYTFCRIKAITNQARAEMHNKFKPLEKLSDHEIRKISMRYCSICAVEFCESNPRWNGNADCCVKCGPF